MRLNRRQLLGLGGLVIAQEAILPRFWQLDRTMFSASGAHGGRLTEEMFLSMVQTSYDLIQPVGMEIFCEVHMAHPDWFRSGERVIIGGEPMVLEARQGNIFSARRIAVPGVPGNALG